MSNKASKTITQHAFKYYDIVAMFTIAVILISNTIAQKIIPLGPFHTTAAIMIFPLAYLASDILTEVYGYARARRVNWMIFTCMTLMALCYEAAILFPTAAFWQNQKEFALILGSVPRIVIASIISILVGDFINCYIMSKMKTWTNGKHLWARTIGSTFFGQGIDSLIFGIIAFYGTMPNGNLASIILVGWLLKTAYEALLTPVTYFVINRLKRAEGVDHFDTNIDYTPFSLKVE